MTLGAVVVAAVLVLGGSGDGDAGAPAAVALETTRRLELVADHPLDTRAAERRLEARFTPMRDDDSAFVRCSGREAKPAHSVRRCTVRYPSGMERSVVLLTTARGDEVLSEH